MKTFEENSAAKNKSVTPPSSKPREKSPGVLRNDIDDLKTAFTDAQLGKKSGGTFLLMDFTLFYNISNFVFQDIKGLKNPLKITKKTWKQN